MADPIEDVDEVPVLLAGGGLVGLSTAMFLAQHGVASLAVEQLSGGSPLPRAAFFHIAFASRSLNNSSRRLPCYQTSALPPSQ
jgi:glycine/D-amino acid oxidase-like deaminating enzyme